MPPQRGKPMKSLMSRYGDRLRRAHDEAKTKEVKVNAGELPGGIENGVCQVTKCYFAEFENGNYVGQPYFMATAIVVEPQEHEGKRVVFGPEAVCDTPDKNVKTLEEHVERIENWFKKAGADMAQLAADDAFEVIAQAIQDGRPYMRFRTWQGRKKNKGETGYVEKYDGPNAPEPRVNHDWGLAIDYTPGETNDVQDETEEAPPAKPAPKAPPAKPTGKKAPPPPPPEKPDLSESDDLEALVEAANDASDEEYQAMATQRLEALAISVGKDADDVQGANSWEEVADWIREGSAEPELTDEEPAEPQTEDLYNYSPIDPKTKKRGRPVMCEVIKVNKKNSTVDLRNTVNKKLIYPAVAWADLSAPE